MFAPYANAPRGRAAGHLCSAYTHVSVESAAASDRSGHELVRLLFEGFLAAVARARGALQQGDTAARVRRADPPAARSLAGHRSAGPPRPL